MLHDDVLLDIFDFCLDQDLYDTKQNAESWQSLVHVCRRWRSVVFGSSYRLNLRLSCSSRTPVRDTLDVWPALPLLIWDDECRTKGLDNIIAALEHSDRVNEIRLGRVSSLYLTKVSAAMQEPFPALTYLDLWSHDETTPALPDSFLGGSASRLQVLWLNRIPFPGLPKLLLSATRLVDLHLREIPHSGYISPKTMLTILSMLTSLRSLRLCFLSPQSHPGLESQLPPSPARSLLPVLTSLEFKGVSEYLDDLVAGINAPQLRKLTITFFNQIVFDLPQFIQFINRTPELKALAKAHIVFGQQKGVAEVYLSSQIPSGYAKLRVGILCREFDWQVSSIEQVCTTCLPSLSTLEDLYIYKAPQEACRDPFRGLGRGRRQDWKDNTDNTLWLELLHSFNAVKNLYLSKDLAQRIAPVLQQLAGDRNTEVFPTLKNINIFFERDSSWSDSWNSLEDILHKLLWDPSKEIVDHIEEGIREFVASRQPTSYPITCRYWENAEQDMVLVD